MSLAGSFLLTLGALILVIAAIGLHTLPDALSRQHAATKAGSLGVVCIIAGTALLGLDENGGVGWIVRALAIIAIVWLTMPVASHVLARAAYRRQLETGAAVQEVRIPDNEAHSG